MGAATRRGGVGSPIGGRSFRPFTPVLEPIVSRSTPHVRHSMGIRRRRPSRISHLSASLTVPPASTAGFYSECEWVTTPRAAESSNSYDLFHEPVVGLHVDPLLVTHSGPHD